MQVSPEMLFARPGTAAKVIVKGLGNEGISGEIQSKLLGINLHIPRFANSQ